MKKTPGDITILHMCTINDNYMVYGSWDMEHNEQNFLSFWTIFSTFTPLKTQKIKILKKWKKQLEILSFYTSVPKIIIIWYTVAEIWRMTDVIIFHFGLFWSFYLPFLCSWWKQIINTLSFSCNNLALLRKIHCKSASTSLIFFLPFCQAWRSFSQGVFKSFSKSLESAILS